MTLFLSFVSFVDWFGINTIVVRVHGPLAPKIAQPPHFSQLTNLPLFPLMQRYR